eukprot:TRINITY_DN1358_c0_g1_i1.p1 TRINITY_DN1358_c0_g1~~TRINITY_DN1358_c0_g1_i1.p1  ORF type:complete len:484 (-),score=125.94 TRINITY_DN1358_c0_g1_i1:1395-2846(-)
MDIEVLLTQLRAFPAHGDEYELEDLCRQIAGAVRKLPSEGVAGLLLHAGGTVREGLRDARAPVVALSLQLLRYAASVGSAAATRAVCAVLDPYVVDLFVAPQTPTGAYQSCHLLFTEIARQCNGDIGEGVRARLLAVASAASESRADELVRFRVLGLAADLVAAQPPQADAALYAGFVAQVPRLLAAKDPVVSLNAVELVSQMCVTKQGTSLVCRAGLFVRLYGYIRPEAPRTPEAAPLAFATLRLFSQVVHDASADDLTALLSDAPLDRALEAIFDADTAPRQYLEELIGAVAKIGSAAVGIDWLMSRAPRIMEGAVRCALSAEPSLRQCGMNATATLLTSPLGDVLTKRLCTLVDRACEGGAGALARAAAVHARSLDDALAHAAFYMLQGLASQGEWGLRALDTAPAFVEFITDRSGERARRSDKTVCEWQYAVAQVIAGAGPEACTAVFGAERAMVLVRFVQQGPFYKPPSVDIDWEKQD